MAYLSFRRRNPVPTYLDPAEITTGEVEFDPSRCTNCGICAQSCPLGSIHVPETKGEIPRLAQAGPDIYMCFGCGNCVSVCPYEAASLKRLYTTHTRYNRLSRAPVLTGPKRY